MVQRVQPGSPILGGRASQATLTLLGPEGVAALPASAAAPGSVSAQQAPGLSPAGDGAPQASCCGPAPQWSPCGGLNGSALLAAAFQEPRGHAAYAVTASGRLVLLALAGNGGKKGCQVGLPVSSTFAFIYAGNVYFYVLNKIGSIYK